MDLGERATSVGALADPTRRALYEYVVSRPDAVGREEAATALDLPPHTANFHLDRLVEAGLLDSEFRRLTGRTGPGAGRPSKLYRRAERQWSVSLPDRHYDLVGAILASGIERARDGRAALDEAIDAAAAETGRSVGAAAAPGDLGTFTGVLAGQGTSPGSRTTTPCCWPTAPSTRSPRTTPRWSAGSTVVRAGRRRRDRLRRRHRTPRARAGPVLREGQARIVLRCGSMSPTAASPYVARQRSRNAVRDRVYSWVPTCSTT